MSTVSTSAVTNGVSAAPPTPQEVQRKLSMHSKSPPTNLQHRRKASVPKALNAQAPLSGTESDSDVSTFSPSSAPAVTLPDTTHLAPQVHQTQQVVQSAPLSVIAERRNPSGEETDDEEDDDWRSGDGRSVEETKALDDEVTTKAGYLTKKGERRKTWKRRWFVLRQTQLSYYKSDKEYQLLRLLPISEIHAVSPVTLKRHSHAFGIVTPARTYYVKAGSAKEVDEWIRALNEAKSRLKDGTTTTAPSTNVASLPAPVPRQGQAVPPGASAPITIPVAPRTPPPSTTLGVSPSSPSHAANAAIYSSSDSEDNDATTSMSPSGPARRLADDQMSPKGQITDPKKIVLQGYLMKCGSKRKNWRKRWFVLTPEKVIYSKSHLDFSKSLAKPHKQIALDKVLDALECSVGKHGHILGGANAGGEKLPGAVGMTPSNSTATTGTGIPSSVSTGANLPGSQSQNPTSAVPTSNSPPSVADSSMLPQLPHTFKIITPKRCLLLCAPSEEEEIKWLSAVRALIARRKGNSVDFSGPATGLDLTSVHPNAVPPTPTVKRTRRETGPTDAISQTKELHNAVSPVVPVQAIFPTHTSGNAGTAGASSAQ